MAEHNPEDSYSASTPTRTNYAIIAAFVLSTCIALPVCVLMGWRDKARHEAVEAKVAALEQTVERLQRDLAAARLKLDAVDARQRNMRVEDKDNRPLIFPPKQPNPVHVANRKGDRP